MRRIAIIGSGGAGKSTLARTIGEILGLPVIHLDKEYWRPGWIETPEQDWKVKVEELISGDEWVMDGNFGGTMEFRLAAAETVVFLDLPRGVCVRRVLKRLWTYYGRTRPDMSKGCNEKFDLEFFAWVWNFQKKKKPGIEARLARLDKSKNIIRLSSTRDIDTFVESLRSQRPGTN